VCPLFTVIVINHVTKLKVKFKWDTYARELFTLELKWFIFQLGLLSAWSICVVESTHFDVSVGPDEEKSFRTLLGSGPIAGKENLGYSTNWASFVGACILILVWVKSVYEECHEIKYWGWQYFKRYDNYLDAAMYGMLAVTLLSYGQFWMYNSDHGPLSYTEPLSGITVLLYYIKSLWYLQGFRQTGTVLVF
jgi:hypothetical protein